MVSLSCSWWHYLLYTGKEELTHLKRPWCWERLKAGGEGDDRGWDGWMASPTQWTWVWVNSGSWWWTGRPRVLRFMGSQRVGHDWATELSWTADGMSVAYINRATTTRERQGPTGRKGDGKRHAVEEPTSPLLAMTGLRVSYGSRGGLGRYLGLRCHLPPFLLLPRSSGFWISLKTVHGVVLACLKYSIS